MWLDFTDNFSFVHVNMSKRLKNFSSNVKVQNNYVTGIFETNSWFKIVCAKVMITLILHATATDTAICSSINFFMLVLMSCYFIRMATFYGVPQVEKWQHCVVTVILIVVADVIMCVM
jgi:hypothetical protein